MELDGAVTARVGRVASEMLHTSSAWEEPGMTDRAGTGEFDRVWEGTPAVHLDASQARGASVWFGLLFYALPIVGVLAGLHALIRVAGGAGLSFGLGALLALVLLALIIGRGLTMSAQIGGDAVRVRNRWRTVHVAWDEIEKVEISTAAGYAVADLVDDLSAMFRPGGEYHEPTDPCTYDVLAITRHDRRHRLKVYASMGFTGNDVTRGRIEAALAAHGHRLVDPVPLPPSSPPLPPPPI